MIAKADWQRLEAAEQAEAQRLGLEAFKFGSNEEMLAVIGAGAARLSLINRIPLLPPDPLRRFLRRKPGFFWKPGFQTP